MNVGKAIMEQPARVEEAKEFLDKAVSLSTQPLYKTDSDETKSARLARGEFFVKTGDIEKAKKDFDAALKIEEDDNATLDVNKVSGNIGDIYFKNGKEKEAMEWMTLYISKDPKNHEKQATFKEVLEKNNKADKIDEILQAALDEVFQHVQELNNHCKDLRKKGYFQEAVNKYTEILNEHPSDEGLWFNKGRALLDFSKQKEQKKAFDEAEQLYKEAMFHFKQAVQIEKKYLKTSESSRIMSALEKLQIDQEVKKIMAEEEKND